MNFPEDLRYTKDHEWVRLEGNIATVGITSYATGELGDIVYIEIETEGETLEQEAAFGSVEAVKTVSDLFMPVAGTVAEINAQLEDAPETVNEDPYGEGWMVKLELGEEGIEQCGSLLTADQYGGQVGA